MPKIAPKRVREISPRIETNIPDRQFFLILAVAGMNFEQCG